MTLPSDKIKKLMELNGKTIQMISDVVPIRVEKLTDQKYRFQTSWFDCEHCQRKQSNHSAAGSARCSPRSVTTEMAIDRIHKPSRFEYGR